MCVFRIVYNLVPFWIKRATRERKLVIFPEICTIDLSFATDALKLGYDFFCCYFIPTANNFRAWSCKVRGYAATCFMAALLLLGVSNFTYLRYMPKHRVNTNQSLLTENQKKLKNGKIYQQRGNCWKEILNGTFATCQWKRKLIIDCLMINGGNLLGTQFELQLGLCFVNE